MAACLRPELKLVNLFIDLQVLDFVICVRWFVLKKNMTSRISTPYDRPSSEVPIGASFLD